MEVGMVKQVDWIVEDDYLYAYDDGVDPPPTEAVLHVEFLDGKDFDYRQGEMASIPHITKFRVRNPNAGNLNVLVGRWLGGDKKQIYFRGYVIAERITMESWEMKKGWAKVFSKANTEEPVANYPNVRGKRLLELED